MHGGEAVLRYGLSRLAMVRVTVGSAQATRYPSVSRLATVIVTMTVCRGVSCLRRGFLSANCARGILAIYYLIATGVMMAL